MKERLLKQVTIEIILIVNNKPLEKRMKEQQEDFTQYAFLKTVLE